MFVGCSSNTNKCQIWQHGHEERDGERERQTERQTDRQRQRDRETERQREKVLASKEKSRKKNELLQPPTYFRRWSFSILIGTLGKGYPFLPDKGVCDSVLV